MNIEISPKEYERKLNWHDAKLFCDLLTIDGKMDWRLPTKDELNEIYNSENDFVGDYYWSSTEYDAGYAWVQLMSGGYQGGLNKNYSGYVRAVRSSSL